MDDPNTEATGWSPAYISFRTLLNLIERMEGEGVPKQIDKSYLKNLSGGTQAQLLVGLRALGLMTDTRAPTQQLRDLVGQEGNRPRLVREILEAQYSWAIDLGVDATQDQLEEEFRKHGPKLGAATREKAIAFYTAAARFAGVPLSKFFRSSTPQSGAGAPRPASRPRRTKGLGSQRRTGKSGVTPPSAPEHPETFGAADMRRRYFELLLKKVGEAGELDPDLLDRIEKLMAGDENTNPPQ
jgi:hypothetical protein